MSSCALGETGLIIEVPESPNHRTKKDLYNRFIHDQIHEILKHKWLESEKARRDLGDEACIDWIMKFADVYREGWERKNGKI